MQNILSCIAESSSLNSINLYIMENQKSFNEIEKLIRNELLILQKPRIEALKLIIEDVPKKFAQKLHDNYLGVSPTRAILSTQFHGSLNSEERQELLQILDEKFTDDLENQSS